MITYDTEHRALKPSGLRLIIYLHFSETSLLKIDIWITVPNSILFLIIVWQNKVRQMAAWSQDPKTWLWHQVSACVQWRWVDLWWQHDTGGIRLRSMLIVSILCVLFNCNLITQDTHTLLQLYVNQLLIIACILSDCDGKFEMLWPWSWCRQWNELIYAQGKTTFPRQACRASKRRLAPRRWYRWRVWL